MSPTQLDLSTLEKYHGASVRGVCPYRGANHLAVKFADGTVMIHARRRGVWRWGIVSGRTGASFKEERS